MWFDVAILVKNMIFNIKVLGIMTQGVMTADVCQRMIGPRLAIDVNLVNLYIIMFLIIFLEIYQKLPLQPTIHQLTSSFRFTLCTHH